MKRVRRYHIRVVILLVFLVLIVFIVLAIVLYINNAKKQLWEKSYIIKEIGKVDTTIKQNWSSQGCDVYNGFIFQAFNSDEIITFNMNNLEPVSVFPSTIGHGDCIEFSNHCENENEYPYLYSTSDTTPLMVYVNRVTERDSELIGTYWFPAEETGYYAGHCTDFEKQTMYTIGYAINNYQSEANNYMIICEWDLQDCYVDLNGYLVPKKVKSFQIPFIITVQDQKCHEGYIWLVSSDWKEPDTKIIVIDPTQEKIVCKIVDFPEEIKHNEAEGISFVSHNKVLLHVSLNSYYIIEFR